MMRVNIMLVQVDSSYSSSIARMAEWHRTEWSAKTEWIVTKWPPKRALPTFHVINTRIIDNTHPMCSDQ